MRVASDGIRDWRALTARLEKLPHVKAAAPGLYEQVLISHGARSGGALIEGVRSRSGTPRERPARRRNPG